MRKPLVVGMGFIAGFIREEIDDAMEEAEVPDEDRAEVKRKVRRVEPLFIEWANSEARRKK